MTGMPSVTHGPSTMADAAGRVRTNTYDVAGQNTATQFPDGTIATNMYDRVGRRTTMMDWGGTSTYAFDAVGRQSGQTDAAGFVQAYLYDANGNRTALQLATVGNITYTFDSMNRLATTQKPGNQLYTMMYDDDSRRTTMMLGNGSTRQYAYDARSQLTTQVELNASNTPIVTLIDTYDAVGNRMTRSVNGTLSTWTYDDLYRLTGQLKPGQVATYTLDGVGNLKTMWEGGAFPKTFTVDAADKIVTMVEGVDLTTYTWTGYGALASEVTGNASTAYSYSGQDQLVGITDPNGVKSTYSFSGDGLRRTAQNGNVQPTTMIWDGSDYLYLDGPLADTLVLTLGSEIVSAGNYDLLPDSLGSVLGDIRAGFDPRLLYEYWPYGTRADAAGRAPFPFLYVGSLGYHYDSADRDYVRARELYKKLGRWMQTDPLWPEERAFLSHSASPTYLVDPYGLKSCKDVMKCLSGEMGIPGFGKDGKMDNPCQCGSNPKSQYHRGQADIALAICVIRAECPSFDADNCGPNDNGGGLGQLTGSAIEQTQTWCCNSTVKTKEDTRGGHWCRAAIVAMRYLDCVGMPNYGKGAYGPKTRKMILACAECMRKFWDCEKCTRLIYPP